MRCMNPDCWLIVSPTMREPTALFMEEGSLKHEGKASMQLCNVLRSPDSTAAINASRSTIALYHSPTDFLLSFSGHFGKTALLSLLCRPWMMVWLSL